MKRFLIGQFEKFDTEKQKRDFRDYFWGIEATQMKSYEELENLKENIKERKLNVGIHFPLLNNQWRLRDPQYLSKDSKTFEESISYIESEIKRAQEINPDYILIHYPKPVILEDKVDWSFWRFYDNTEYYYESEISYDFFEDKSKKFFEVYSKQGEKYNFVPLIELDALNRYIYDTDLLERLLEKYPNVRVCLDFGRIHMQECNDSNFDGIDIIRRFGKYTYLVHLWNAKIGANGHYPALRSLRVEEGWGDMRKYFSALNEVNHQYKVLFEHRPDLINDEELEECYQWVGELIE